MIRKASAAGLPGVAAIYEAIFDREAQGTAWTNWRRGSYPTASDAREALEAGTLYVGEEAGAIWGAVNLNGVQLPEYGRIPWAIPAEAEAVGVIHTLCVHPDWSGRGLARELARFCEEEARALGKTVLRLDTWEGNLPANRLYQGLGYRLAGSAEFLFHGCIRETLNCYEKKL